MSPDDSNDQAGTITLAEASRIAGVSPSTLKRWADEGLVPVQDGAWTPASAAQARVIARMRERGFSAHAVRAAARRGPLALAHTEALCLGPPGRYPPEPHAV